jgi:hypothetical protein
MPSSSSNKRPGSGARGPPANSAVAAAVFALALGAGCLPPPDPPIPATLSSLNQQLFQVSCNFSSCHDSSAGHDQGSLDLMTDPYGALLGADGGGVPAQNIKGTATGLLRVKPGDPENSLLWIKLKLNLPAKVSDALYGEAMPETAPGTVPQNVLDAVYAWIDAGAPNN